AAAPDEVKTRTQQATAHLETAEAELKKPERTWAAVALLEGVMFRWGNEDAAAKARKLLAQIRGDAKQTQLLAEQRGAEERLDLTSRSKALEHFVPAHDNHRHPSQRALLAWRLGLAFKGDGLVVATLVPKGPADAAGVKAGDAIIGLGDMKVTSPVTL